VNVQDWLDLQQNSSAATPPLGRPPRCGKYLLSSPTPAKLSSKPSASGSTLSTVNQLPPDYLPPDAQEMHDESLLEQLASRVSKKLPDAPQRGDYGSAEEFEEAMSGWRSNVGRIKGMVARSHASRQPPE